jgi:hypothetical protein
MKELRKAFDSLPWIATLLLTIFFDPIFAGIYRITKGDTVQLVIGILWFVTGGVFGIGWIIDVVTVIVSKKITFLA